MGNLHILLISNATSYLGPLCIFKQKSIVVTTPTQL
jgi:hypothetical protein